VLHRALALADGLGLVLALLAAFLLVGRDGRPLGDLWWMLPTLPLWTVIFKAYALYDRDAKRISHHALDDLAGLFHGLVLGTLALWLFYRYAPPQKLDYSEILVFASTAMVLLLVLRDLARGLVTRALGPERVALLGTADATTKSLVAKMRIHHEYNLDPVGVIGLTEAADVGLPNLGRYGEIDLEGLVKEHGIERILVSSTEMDDETLMRVLQDCRTFSVKLGILPRVYEALGPSVELDEVGGVTVLGVNPPKLVPSSRVLKRSMDVVGATLLLLLFAPLMAVIAVAIRLDSRGPVFFTQERIGRGGRRFRLRKFRTMVADAEERRDELLGQSTDPNWLKLENDPRITRVGRLLRLYSLDELPQLWSVLKGDMSLVGPRPLIESEDRLVSNWTRSRLDLTPGITGLWQVLGRTNIPFEEMVKLDYLYVTNWSLWGDVRLLLRTLPAVMARRGAN
jgi:exopolysaccharide biosynthesis polyprenyl glycosylphosphotransferase